VSLGIGNGPFSIASSTRLIANRSISFYKPQIWLLDVNEDRRIDLVTQNGRNTINEDGRLDIVTSSFKGDALTVLLGR
jgi:hypothetical protein